MFKINDNIIYFRRPNRPQFGKIIFTHPEKAKIVTIQGNTHQASHHKLILDTKINRLLYV